MARLDLLTEVTHEVLTMARVPQGRFYLERKNVKYI